MREERALLSLGSNLGPREETILAAIDRLARERGVRPIALSSLYETSPVGVGATHPFINAVCVLAVSLGPRELLARCRAIEDAFGRRRDLPVRDRTLDLDILVHGAAIVDEPDLVLPHPRLRERLFVLEPLAELCPDLALPPDGAIVLDLRRRWRGEGWARRVSSRGSLEHIEI